MVKKNMSLLSCHFSQPPQRKRRRSWAATHTPQSSPSESFFKNVRLISFRARVGTLKTVKAADDSGEVSGTESNF